LKKGQTEAYIREQFVKILKKYVGRGPKDTIVRISEKFIIVEFKEVLTPFEKLLLKDKEDGHKQIQEMREKLFKYTAKDYVMILEELIGTKVLDIIFKINIDNNVEYGLIVFEKDIEENIDTELLSVK